MAIWPATLPVPTLTGYQGDSGANVQRTDFDAGPARQRLRYGDAPDDVSANWRFSPAEMVIFRAFWKIDINKGTDWFVMELDIGDGFMDYEVRMQAGKYQYQPLPGMNWQVNTKLEVRTI